MAPEVVGSNPTNRTKFFAVYDIVNSPDSASNLRGDSTAVGVASSLYVR